MAFVAAFGVVLAGIKLRDDVEDSGRWFNRVLLWKYERQIRAAQAQLESASPGLSAAIATALEEHKALESRDRSVSAGRFAQPTGSGFASVFSAFAMAFTSESVECGAAEVDRFRKIGWHIGRAIITWDCAVDFEHDRIRGHFNPLQHPDDVRASFELCLLELANVGWLLPEHGVCRSIVSSVMFRVRRQMNRQAAENRTRILERWGVIREQGFTYARCDCCDCCSGLECCGAVLEGAACCNIESGHCPCCCDLPCHDCRSSQGSAQAGSPSAGAISDPTAARNLRNEYFQGRTGCVVGDLNPTGYVLIDGEKVPAKSASGNFVPEGTPVKVTASDAFGVTVVPLSRLPD